jgi:protocatechuate 3,4-dioxygenase beta subunit
MTTFFSKAKIAITVVLALSLTVTAFGVVRHQGPAVLTSQDATPRPPQKQPLPDAPPRPQAEASIEVRGRVLDPEGKPLSGAKLYLGQLTPDGLTVSPQATSGPEGRFRFAVSRSALQKDMANQSACQVMAVAEGHGCDWVEMSLAGDEMTLRLVHDVPLGARILDSDGRPVAGAKVTIMGISATKDDLEGYIGAIRKGDGYGFAKRWGGALAGQPAVLTTGPDGRFHLRGAGRERIVHLRVTGPAIASGGFDVMTRVADSVKNPKGWMHVYGASSDYVGRPSRLIRGVVRDKETGKAIPGVSVGAPHSWVNTVTDKEGHYKLLGEAKASAYPLLARPADGLHFQRYVRLQDTPGLGPMTCDIDLARGLTVRGRVWDKAMGRPVVGARVDYYPLGGNSYVDKTLPGSWDPRAETATSSDGSYTITVLPGPGVIGVTASRWDTYMPAAVSLKERKDFFKTPLAEDRDEDYLTRYAGDGSYGAISPNFYNALLLLEPVEKDEILVRDVALERPLEWKGRVVGPDDQPLTGVRVCGLVRHGVETLKGDEFIIRGINPKSNRPLVFYHKDKNLGVFLKDLRSEAPPPLTVKLQPCGSASGRIVDRDGQPVAGLRLHVIGFALRIMGEEGGGYQNVTTDKEGRFRAQGLVPGQEYVVEEWDETPSYPRVFAKVVVESGKHKDMGDIKMERN